MKLKEVLDKTSAFFKTKNIDSPRLDAELLLAHGLKIDRIELYLKFDQPLKEDELAICRDLVRRRSQGEPVAYILGERGFYGSIFKVSPATLIPRPETETLVEEALAWADNKNKAFGILDLGCGTGCIGLSLLKYLPQARLLSVDISEEALAVAKENAQDLGLINRVRFLAVDAADSGRVLQSFRDVTGQEHIDILVSNPPYIARGDKMVEENVQRYEPHVALYADDEGQAFLKKWSSLYGPHLSRHAVCLMEMGMSQGADLQKHFEELNIFERVRIIKDLSAHDRIIYGEKNG